MSAILRPNPSPTEAQIRTPLARARGLGAAKEGADHFWRQRITAVANIVLVSYAVGVTLRMIGADYGTVRGMLASPLISLPLLLLIVSGMIHMRLGMQTIIEDYIHSDGRKLVFLALNTFFAVAVGATCIYAVLRLSFGV